MLSANERTADRNLTFDLSALNVEAGAIVQIEEVSDGNIAEVTQRIPLPANGRIVFQQSRESVALISVSEVARNLFSLEPTDDATVRAGNGNNAGSSNNIFVRNIVNTTTSQMVARLVYSSSTFRILATIWLAERCFRSTVR